MKRMGAAVLGLVVILAASLPLAAQTPGKAWSEKWKAENKRWIAYHLIGLQPDRLDAAKRLVAEGLAPLGFNALILEVDYSFQFKSHPELETRGLNKEQARELAEVCRQHGIRLIPLMNCLGHQSWGARPGALLKKYPQFDETPSIPPDDKKIYCREWCPSHPDVNKIVFELIDELIDAFDADAFHVGMDEVFLIGDKNCPRCKGKDVGELFAKVVNELHDHLVGRERRGDADVERPAPGLQDHRLRDVGGQRHRLAPGDRPGAEGYHHVRLALRDACDLSENGPGKTLPVGAVLPGKGLPRAAVALEKSRVGHGVPPRRQTGRDRQDARRAVHRLVGQPGRPAGRFEERAEAVQTGGEAQSNAETTQGVAATIQAGLKELQVPAK